MRSSAARVGAASSASASAMSLSGAIGDAGAWIVLGLLVRGRPAAVLQHDGRRHGRRLAPASATSAPSWPRPRRGGPRDCAAPGQPSRWPSRAGSRAAGLIDRMRGALGRRQTMPTRTSRRSSCAASGPERAPARPRLARPVAPPPPSAIPVGRRSIRRRGCPSRGPRGRGDARTWPRPSRRWRPMPTPRSRDGTRIWDLPAARRSSPTRRPAAPRSWT